MKTGFLAMGALFASTLYGAPCVVGSLQSYITGGVSCSVGAVEFSQFTLADGLFGATPINPNTVTLTPGGTQFQPLLVLSLNQNATGNDLLDLIFRVRAMGLLTATSVTLGSPTATGDGAVTGIADACAGGIFAGPGPSGCPTTSGSAAAFAVDGFSQTMDRKAFSPTGFFDIFFDVTLDAAGGTASLNTASLGVEAVPEPSAVVLVAAGIGALGLIRRRRSTVSAKETV